MNSIKKKSETPLARCRTCTETKPKRLFPLSTRTDRFPEKSLVDLLLDIVKIDVSIQKTYNPDVVLPQHLCDICKEQLTNAYYFVIQAQQVNAQLLAAIDVGKNLDCLVETPIDIPTQEFMHIKLEIENADDSLFAAFEAINDSTENVLDSTKTLKQSYELLDEAIAPYTNKQNKNSDPITISGRKKRNSNNVKLADQSLDDEFDDIDVDDPTDLNFSEIGDDRKPQKSLKKKDNVIKERFLCNVCGKTFAHNRHLLRHAKLHTLVFDYHCEHCQKGFYRKDKYNDHMRVFDRNGKCAPVRNSINVQKQANVTVDNAAVDIDVDVDAADNDVDHHLDNYSSDSDDDNKPTLKRRNSRQVKVEQKTNEEGRYVCDICLKSFAWRKDVQRHAKSHFAEAKYFCEYCEKNFLRKDKYMDHIRTHQRRMDASNAGNRNIFAFGEPLYESAGYFKRLQCQLCSQQFARIRDLRKHLLQHANMDSMVMLTHDNIVVKELYPNITDLATIKSSICADINALRFNKYYAIVNKYGYEMSISDSDDGDGDVSDGDVDLDDGMKYECELCAQTFKRKRQIYAHTRDEHANDVLPHHCNICKLGFVSEVFHGQHTRTHCRSKERKYQCNKCPGKFMWLENLTEHECTNRKSKVDLVAKTYTRQLQCALCDEKFKTLKQLSAHLPLHSDGKTDVKMHSAIYFKCFHSLDADSDDELSKHIALDYAANNLTRFYSALNDSGNELDLNDSEISNDESEDYQLTRTYECELCGQVYARRKHLSRHQAQTHADDIAQMTHRCVQCNKSFVNVALLERHQRLICQNSYIQYHCEKCDECFVWQRNYEIHQVLKHAQHLPVEHSRQNVFNKLQCDECDKVFIWPKDLTRHKRIHQPDTQKYSCVYCERKFVRKDNMQSHMKTHIENAALSAANPALSQNRVSKVQSVAAARCKPHGCKLIQCMICLSKHTKIADLRTHLRTHQYRLDLTQRSEPIGAISQLLYPDESPMSREFLSERIQKELAAQKYERFYSIINESGYELTLDSSETDSDDSDNEMSTSHPKLLKATSSSSSSKELLHTCDLCAISFDRKYQLYAHQANKHSWLEAPHACQHCHARFLNQQLLQHHYRTLCKNVRKRFICRKCPLRYHWKENYKVHISGHEEEAMKQSKPLECRECKRTFVMQKDLTRHLLTVHTKETPAFNCLWCTRTFKRKDNLIEHIERHNVSESDLLYAITLNAAYCEANGVKSIYCKICDIQFTSILDLRTHLLMERTTTETMPSSFMSHHSFESQLNYSITNQRGYELHLDDSETDIDEKPVGVPLLYTCELCQLQCKRRYQLFQHQQKMHKQELLPLKCDKCYFKCVSKDMLLHHIRTQCLNTEKQYKCEKCGYKFMWNENLQTHLSLYHQPDLNDMPPENALSTNKATVFQCLQCDRRYNRKDRLSAHIKKMHMENSGSIAAIAQSATSSAAVGSGGKGKKEVSEKRFLCPFCGRAVSSSSNLIIHMRRHTGEKPFKCDFCEMAFPRSSDMQCHRRTHTGEKPHKCTVCDKAFSRSYKLQQHMRIHNGERPYKCTYCVKSFTQSNDLTLHIRRHTGERPYVCGICGERFIQGTALKNHRLTRGHFEVEEPRRSILEQFPSN